jgi:hypothetical protein
LVKQPLYFLLSFSLDEKETKNQDKKELPRSWPTLAKLVHVCDVFKVTKVLCHCPWCPHQSTQLPVVWCLSAAAPTTVLVANFQNTCPSFLGRVLFPHIV